MREQSGYESDNKVETMREQSGNQFTGKNKEKVYLNIQSLSGIQLLIFNKILDMKSKSNKDYVTVVNTTLLATELCMSVNVLRVSLRRIVAKNLLVREKGFMGRNGASNFKIPNMVLKFKEEIEESNKITYKENNNNNIIINTIIPNVGITKEPSMDSTWWNKLNISNLEEYGFKHAQFKQIEGMNSFDVIQESINHFAWGLEYNSKNERYKENPSRILLSVLKKGGAWIEDGYRDPQEIALEKILEAKKKSADRKKKLEDDLYVVALNEWIDTLTQNEIEQLVPQKSTKDLTPQKSRLSSYFKEKIWPLTKKEYI